ncbi:MAG: AbrB/MazE/SpoVT family DNA-binding domain-containing protein [Patescibacteria group bacterium]
MSKTTVAKWGNSIAVRIPDRIVREAGIVAGSGVSVVWKRGKITIAKVLPNKRPTLDDLIDGITPKNRHDYVWKDMEDVGSEIWKK